MAQHPFHTTDPALRWMAAGVGSQPAALMGETPVPEALVAVTGKRILLVEDDEASIMLLTGYLSVKGYWLDVARHGAEGLAQCRRARPHLIVTDIRMPVMDGFETLRRLRADPALADIPAIALTALAMPEDRAQCLAAGADAYLTKPVDLADLVAAIERLLRAGRREKHEGKGEG